MDSGALAAVSGLCEKTGNALSIATICGIGQTRHGPMEHLRALDGAALTGRIQPKGDRREPTDHDRDVLISRRGAPAGPRRCRLRRNAGRTRRLGHGEPVGRGDDPLGVRDGEEPDQVAAPLE